MIHPRLTGAIGTMWAAEIGRFGAFGDVSWMTRWGTGACGMFEATFTMPLPVDFEHPLLKRGVRVELMDQDLRVGSSLAISQIARGSLDQPWTITAEGVGRLAEGRSSFYAFDGSGNVTVTPSVAVDQAIARGLPWAGRDATISTSPFGTATEPQPVGALLSSIADNAGNHWGVWDDNLVGFRNDPTTPTLQITPQTISLGVSDDQYATVVYVRYTDSGSSTNATVHSPASAPPAESAFERQEYLANLTTSADYPPMSAATAQDYADGIYAKAKGRLAFTDRMVLTSNELLTMGGTPVDLSMVEAGHMVRVNGVSSQLLEYDGLEYLDFVIGETKRVDGASTIEIAPAGLAPRDIASIVEDITGTAAAA